MQHERRNGDATIYAWVGRTSAAGVRRRGGENIVTASVRADETNEEQEKKKPAAAMEGVVDREEDVMVGINPWRVEEREKRGA